MVLVSDRGAGLLIRKDGISIGSSSSIINDGEFLVWLCASRMKGKKVNEKAKKKKTRRDVHPRTHAHTSPLGDKFNIIVGISYKKG